MKFLNVRTTNGVDVLINPMHVVAITYPEYGGGVTIIKMVNKQLVYTYERVTL